MKRHSFQYGMGAINISNLYDCMIKMAKAYMPLKPTPLYSSFPLN